MNPVLYIISRNDLGSLNPGKAMAQCAHAANAMVDRHRADGPLLRNEKVDELFRLWEMQTPQGFGTTIVLVGKMQDLVDVSLFLKNYSGPVVHGFTYDPTYPLVVPREVVPLLDQRLLTAEPLHLDNNRVLLQYNETPNFWALVDKDDPEIQNLFSKFSLHP